MLFLLSYLVYGQVNDSVSVPDTVLPSETTSNHSFVIRSIVIDIEEAGGQETVFKEMAIAVMNLTCGDRVTDTTITQRVESLKNCDRFQKISVDTESILNGVQLHIRLKPFYYVKDLPLTGSWPLFTNEVLNCMTMHVGSPFSYDLLNTQEQLVHELYRREGITLHSVNVSAERDEKDGNYIVHIRIQPGRWFQIGKIIVTGDGTINRLRWRYRLGGFREFSPLKGKRFVRKSYNNVLKTALKKYRESQYYNAQIQDSVTMDSSSYMVAVHIQVEKGPQHLICFQGNKHFSKKTLKKQCRFESGNRNNLGIRKTRRQLIDFYRKNGFNSVTITFDTKETAHKKMITFNIREGVRTTVVNRRITGNSRVKRKEIERQVLLKKGKPFNNRVLADDIEGIHQLYLQKGFVDTQVDTVVQRSEQKNNDVGVTVEYHIVEGVQRMVSSVHIESDSVLSDRELLKRVSLKAGSPFVFSQVYRDREVLAARISEKGYPYCRVRATLTFNRDSSAVTVMYAVDPGKKVSMGRVYPIGNFKTAPSVIRREIVQNHGDSFSLRKTLESQRNIQNLPIFNSAQLKPLGLIEKRDTIHFILKLEEKEPLYLKLRGGYESGIGMYGESKIGDKNLLGLNKHGWLSGRLYHSSGCVWRFMDAGWQTEAALLEPRLFGTRIAASTMLSYERIKEHGLEFHADVSKASLSLMRQFFRIISAGTAFEYELRKASGVHADTGFTSDDMREQYEYRNNLITRSSLRFDNRDSFIRPRKGMYLGYMVEISRGIDNAIDDFIGNELIVKGFVSPYRFLTIGVMGKWQYINDTTLSEDQRLFLGGTQDVRGYPENGVAPGGGNSAISGSLEARIRLPLNLEIALFTDVGKVSTTRDPFNVSLYSPGDFKTTVGIGIRYITPIGPAGLLYGHRLNPVHYGAWHFSLGYTF